MKAMKIFVIRYMLCSILKTGPVPSVKLRQNVQRLGLFPYTHIPYEATTSKKFDPWGSIGSVWLTCMHDVRPQHWHMHMKLVVNRADMNYMARQELDIKQRFPWRILNI